MYSPFTQHSIAIRRDPLSKPYLDQGFSCLPSSTASVDFLVSNKNSSTLACSSHIYFARIRIIIQDRIG